MPVKSSGNKAKLFKPGMRTIPARMLNLLVDGINRQIIGVNKPTQAPRKGKGGGSSVVILYYVSMEDDYIVCEDIDSNVFNVAKPDELRRSTFDGLTIGGVTYTYATAIEREATDGSITETQEITPSYAVGREIYAITPQGGTGLVALDYSDILLLEMDQGRAWATSETVTT